VIAAKRAQPKDDLISALVQAEEAGERLREEELVAMVFLLVVAGHETTVNLIGNGALALLQFPEQLARLRDDPALDATAVEELLRFHSPVEVSTERYAREEIEIASVTIPQGALVYGVLSSANRDETQFEKPTFSTWAARETATWPSDKASTTAWARRWPDSKARSPSGSSSPTNSCAARTGSSSAAPRRRASAIPTAPSTASTSTSIAR
jgi:Cytochrome P450